MIHEQAVIDAFTSKLAEYGIRVADTSRLKLDGNWHRARVDGDRGGSLNLSYKIYSDDRPAGFFQDHKRGFSDTFSVANGQDLSPAEREQARAAWAARQREREAEQRQSYLEAAKRAQAAVQAATGDPASHPYIVRKGIVPDPSAVKVDADGNLIIPVYSAFGTIASLQTISPDGEKLFLLGGQMAGSFHPIKGTDRRRVLVTEGYATGAALNRETGHSVACAMSSGNLETVARKMQAAFPDRELVICADNDHETAARIGRNPGLEAAQRAADVLGCRVVAPQFLDGDPGSDWDDWLRAGGDPDLLRWQIEGEPDYEPEPDERLLDVVPIEVPRETDLQVFEQVPGRPDRLIIASTTPTPATDLDNTVDPVEDDLPEKYTEDNVALAFSHYYADDFRYVAPWGRWMMWEGQRWIPDETRFVHDKVRAICRGVAVRANMEGEAYTAKQKAAIAKTYGLASTMSSVERLATSDRRHAATIEQWDADIWLLNTPAGVVDLRTGSLTPGSRSAHMTKITSVAPGGACPTWHQFLHTTTGGDIALAQFLQRMAGYALTGSTRDHALFFVYGSGGNGKGTFLNTLQWIMGDYAKAAPADMFTERKHEAHTTELARLMGARLVAAQETEEGKRWAEAKIKALTGGDPITARFMRQDDFQFIPQFKLVMTGNHKPGLRNVDEAIKRRLHLIPFTVTISAEDRDQKLGQKLQAEAGGILQWAIEGCIAWQRDGLQPPPSVVAATDEYLEQQDVLGLWMEECCDVGEGKSAKRGDLYKSFKGWADASGEYQMPQKRWVAALEMRGFLNTTIKGYPTVIGISVKPREFMPNQPSGSRWDDML